MRHSLLLTIATCAACACADTNTDNGLGRLVGGCCDGYLTGSPCLIRYFHNTHEEPAMNDTANATQTALTAEQLAKVESMIDSGEPRRAYGYFIEQLTEMVANEMCFEDEEGKTDEELDANGELIDRMTDMLIARLTEVGCD